MQLDHTVKVTVLVAGTDRYHDLYQAAGALRDIVAEAGLPAQVGLGLWRFADPMPVTAETDVFVIYTEGMELGAAEQRALIDLVDQGKGVVFVHSASVVLAGGQEDLTALIGAKFEGHLPDASEGHVPVRIVGGHPVTTRMDDFAVDDEYYLLTVADDATVIAEHQLTDGSWAPVALVREQGQGRVVYTALGHDWRSWGNPWVRQLIRQAVLWVGGIDPSDPGQVSSWSTRFPLGNGRHIGPGPR